MAGTTSACQEPQCSTGTSQRDACARAAAGRALRAAGRPTLWLTATPPCRRWHATWACTGTACCSAIEVEAKALLSRPRDWDVKKLGADEHSWRPSRVGTDRAVTIMVGLTRDQQGRLHARLLERRRRPVRHYLQDLVRRRDRRVHPRRADRRLGLPRLGKRDPRGLTDAVAVLDTSTSSGSAPRWSTRSGAASRRRSPTERQ